MQTHVNSGRQGRLLRKYAFVFAALVGATLIAASIVQMYFAYQETHDRIFELERVEAIRAADAISGFVESMRAEVKSVVGGHADYSLEQRESAFQGLKPRAFDIADVAFLDEFGKEQLFVSRLDLDRRHSGEDHSRDEAFLRTRNGDTYYGPVTFVHESQPQFQIAIPDDWGGGVTVATVNLRLALERVAGITFGDHGYAYVVDGKGKLIAHPDSSEVLKGNSLVSLRQVAMAIARSEQGTVRAKSIDGSDVITAYEPIRQTGWMVLVEQPTDEAYAPLWSLLWRAVGIVLLGLALSLVASVALARRMAAPIDAVRAGASKMREGALEQRIAIDTGDELEDLAEEFNRMAARLADSYATLERRVAERTQELVTARDELARVSRHKSEFLANMSHELRAPLNAIIGFSKLLLEAPELTETQREYARDILDSGTHQLALINDVLDVSKVEAGRLVLDPSVVSVPELVDAAVAFVRPQATQHRITLVEELDPSVGEIQADERKVRQVLLNLLSNAVKFTPDAGRVIVRARRDNGALEIAVSDTGAGIAPEEFGQIFREFGQTSSSRGREGTGLGLALAKRLVELHGGRIWVESTPGQGSTFTFVLPTRLN